jgi:hypothetical protein
MRAAARHLDPFLDSLALLRIFDTSVVRELSGRMLVPDDVNATGS